jgi:hypothetical protein
MSTISVLTTLNVPTRGSSVLTLKRAVLTKGQGDSCEATKSESTYTYIVAMVASSGI